jgi:Fe-Mn family superoxide dismutase
MTLSLPDLPYSLDALAPFISRNTLEFHYKKHHRAYVDKTNMLAADAGLAGASLERIIQETAGKDNLKGLFNNAAQAWNHEFYWKSMRPAGGGQPRGVLAGRIAEAFGNFEKFRAALIDTAISHFGSGWAWVVVDGGKIKVTSTSNADTPLAHGQQPLLTIDVWEHAYYLDHQNRRPEYVSAIVDQLLNWDFAAANLAHH